MNLRLRAKGLDFWVDVRLRRLGTRWIAAADLGDEKEIGLGATARDALEGSLAALSQMTVEKLLSDPAVAKLPEN